MKSIKYLRRKTAAVIAAGGLVVGAAGEADAKPVSDKIAFTVEAPCGNEPRPIPIPIPDWLEGVIKLPIGDQKPLPPLATAPCSPEDPLCEPEPIPA